MGKVDMKEVAVKVADLMRTDLKTIPANATFGDALAALVEAGVSALPVIDEYQRPVGVLTNQDILRATLRRDWDVESRRMSELTPVVDIMSPWPAPVSPEVEVIRAALLMLYMDLKRVFVVDRDALVGVLSQTDITGAVATAKI
jgi:CBS domain-containing protein